MLLQLFPERHIPTPQVTLHKFGGLKLLQRIHLGLHEFGVGVAEKDPPQTETEYSDDLSLELARNSSSASQRRFSISV